MPNSRLVTHNGISLAGPIVLGLLVSLAAVEAKGQATQLSFTLQPSDVTAGASITPAVKVSILDSRGRVDGAARNPVTLRIGAHPRGARLAGTRTVKAVRGVATFADLRIDKAGSAYTLVASSPNLLARAESAPFNVTAGAPWRLIFTVEPPSNIVAGVVFPAAVEVRVVDAQGNTITSATDAVTVAIGANPGGGKLVGTTTVNAVNGVARFPALNIDKEGYGYTVVASSPRLTTATTAGFALKEQEILIVSVGDSVASGQGNPDRPAVWGTCTVQVGGQTWHVPCITEPAQWQDEDCYRSARSGAAMAAQVIEGAPITQVKFVNLGCSGASISGTMGQLDEAARLSSGQQIDALMISAGGNNVDFANYVFICALLEDCYKTSDWYTHAQNEWIRNNIIRVDEKLKKLPEEFDKLDAAINAKLKVNPSSVYITEYFDPTHDELGHFCHMLRGAQDIAERLAEDLGSEGIIVDFLDVLHPRLDFDGITENESEWLFNNVVIPLNREVAKAAQKHGWNYVGRVMSAFSRHGACASGFSDHWVVRGKESLRIQNDIMGTMHPNQKGHEVYRDRLVKFILEGGPRFEVKPSWDARGPLYVSREEQGSFTGSCVFDASNPSTPLACMPEVFLTVVAYDPNGIGRTSVSVDGVVPTYRAFGDQFSERGGPHDLNGDYDCTSVEQREEIVITEYDPESKQTRTVTESRLLGVTDVRPGLVCNLSLENEFERAWFIKITADGTYRLAFTTTPSEPIGVAKTYPYEVKVGLQEQPPTGAGPRVLEATLEAQPSEYQGLCAARIQFSGRISVDGPGLVSYRFVRSDGTKGPVTELAFAAAGSKDVSTTWHVGRSERTGTRKFEGWQSIEILEPERLESNRATFVVTCDPLPAAEPCAPEGKLCP